MSTKNSLRLRLAKGALQTLQGYSAAFESGVVENLSDLAYMDSTTLTIKSSHNWVVEQAANNLDSTILSLCCDFYCDCVAFLEARERPQELVQSWIMPAIKAARQLARLDCECNCLLGLGIAHRFLGDVAQSIESLQQALRLVRELADTKLERRIWAALGQAYYDSGDYNSAIAYHQQVLEGARAEGERQEEARVLTQLGKAYRSLGELDKAVEHLQVAKSCFESLADAHGRLESLNYLARCYRNLGKFSSAIECLEEELVVAERLGDIQAQGLCLGTLADTYFDKGDLPQAIDHYTKAIAIMRDIDNKRYIVGYLADLGNTLASMGRYREAIANLEAAWETARQLENRTIEHHVGGYLALAYLGAGPEFLQKAHDVAAYICDMNIPRNKHFSTSLYAITMARFGQKAVARLKFQDALQHADTILSQNPKYCAAQYTRGLVLAGIGLLSEHEAEDFITQAAVSYRLALDDCAAPGLIINARRLLAALQPIDDGHRLGLIRTTLGD